jgi:hypothetical protein
MTSNEWVHRRVERVKFCDDRTVTRHVSIDLTVPASAPSVSIPGTAEFRVLPLTVMRRKTLVNFSLESPNTDRISLLGLRQNQALVAAMLEGLAVLALESGSSNVAATLDETTYRFIHDVAEGDQQTLKAALDEFDDAPTATRLGDLRANNHFNAIAKRMADNFMMLVIVPVDQTGRMRVRFSYDEPLSLKQRESDWFSDRDRQAPSAPKNGRDPEHTTLRKRFWSNLLLQPVTVRFPVPAAENAESFHFEVEAPPDVQIESATMVAGRPGDNARPSWDRVTGGYAVVGLHVVDVPGGSQSQAQVLLGVPSSSWLATNTLASVTNAVTVTVALVLVLTKGKDRDFTGAAALLALTGVVWGAISRPDRHQMAGRLLRGLRSLAMVSAALPILAAAAMGYLSLFEPLNMKGTAWAVYVGTLLAWGVAYVFFQAWLRARNRENEVQSPWEQGSHVEPAGRLLNGARTWEAAVGYFHFDHPAVKVASAEAVHTMRDHLDAREQERLRELVRAHLEPSPAGERLGRIRGGHQTQR